MASGELNVFQGALDGYQKSRGKMGARSMTTSSVTPKRYTIFVFSLGEGIMCDMRG